MVHIKGVDKKDIRSETCGLLTEYLSSDQSPISIAVVKDIQTTKPHYHKDITEIYWIKEGYIVVLVNKSQRKRLKTGDSLVIKPNEVHEVVEASDNNEVIVLCNPPWRMDDEYTD